MGPSLVGSVLPMVSSAGQVHLCLVLGRLLDRCPLPSVLQVSFNTERTISTCGCFRPKGTARSQPGIIQVGVVNEQQFLETIVFDLYGAFKNHKRFKVNEPKVL